jgi:hypothetical protein
MERGTGVRNWSQELDSGPGVRNWSQELELGTGIWNGVRVRPYAM